MQFVKPIRYEDAIDKLGRKSIVGSMFSSSEWSDVPVQLRDEAFFISRMQSARVLQRGRDGIMDYLAENVETVPNGEKVLKTGSRQAFVDQMQRFMAAEGIERTDGSVRDHTSERRLGLIFDVQTQSAQDYGYWKQGMDPDVLNAFPAQRFIRVKDVKEPRAYHTQFEDQVYLKTDPIWRRINHDFGVDHGPWGWGCGHDVEDVDRDEAEALGLLSPNAVVEPPPDRRKESPAASIKGLDADLVDKLKAEFGDRVTVDGDQMKWNRQAVGRELVAGMGDLRPDPIEEAVKLKVYGRDRDAVRAGLGAIEKVHNTPGLPTVPLEPLKQNWYGHLQPKQTASGIVTDHLAVRGDGPWPALTTVHEAGHFIDLQLLGAAGDFATVQGAAEMRGVMVAMENSARIRALHAKLPATQGSSRRATKYLLHPAEQWARAYTQFVAERSGSPRLLRELDVLNHTDPVRAWSKDDFAPISQAIEALFKQKGWL